MSGHFQIPSAFSKVSTADIHLLFEMAANRRDQCHGCAVIRSIGGQVIHFAFALSAMGTVSRSLRDLTMSCVVILYFLK